MADKTWKKVERAIAAMFGGKRIPVSGRGRGDAPDIEHHLFAFEVKCRPKHPGLLKTAVDQAEQAAANTSEPDAPKIPLVILHEWGERHINDLAVIKVGDFLDILSKVDPVKLWRLKC